jgi:hypothetical protein
LRAGRFAYVVPRISLIREAARLGFRLAKIGIRNPRRLSHVQGMALSASDDVIDRSCDFLRLQ